MVEIFTYIGVIVAAILVSSIGGIILWSMDPTHKNDGEFLIGAWIFALGLAVTGWIIIIKEGLI